MNESLKRIIILSFVYGLLFIVPAFFGVLLSYTAQPGGISQYNAFLAPFLGPWSQILPPNSHPVSTWSAQYSLFAKLLTVVLVFSIIGSALAGYRWLRYTATGTAVFTIVVWVLAGLMKVVSQLS
ncbi:MAG: hypothetical protein A2Z38_04800 [Planctomycetes bacterium RBG_19FT_COMBO_48_8]|nr:MAG: hypothetical protein A2Z38_04800 [Planctomycetes bacterium RBG_19FT_COMBO_48_8]